MSDLVTILELLAENDKKLSREITHIKILLCFLVAIAGGVSLHYHWWLSFGLVWLGWFIVCFGNLFHRKAKK